MRKIRLAVRVGLALATVSSAALAQEESSSSSNALEEVVVTAQKRAESSQDVPISIQAIGAETIEKLGATQLYDLTRAAPSLSVGGIPGSQVQAGLRGVVDYSRNIGIDSRMGVYIDGVYQGRSSTSNQPLLGLESVEILRGPQGTLFGKNTVSGAINLNTRKPADEFSGQISLGAGNEGYQTGSLYLNGPLSDTVAGSIAYSRQERHGYYWNTTLGAHIGDWDQTGFRGQLRFLPSDALEIILAADYGKNESEGPLFTKFADPIYTTAKGPESDMQEFWGLAATINYQMASDYTLSSITAYRDNEYVGEGDEDFTGLVEAFQTRFDEYPQQFSQEFRIVSPLGETFDWVAGLYYFDSSNDQNGRNVFLDPGLLLGNPLLSATKGVIAVPAQIDTTSYAAYVHGNYRFSDRWELTAGLRYTSDEKKVDFAQINTPDNVVAATAVATALFGPELGAILGPQMPGALLGQGNVAYSGDRTDNHVSPMVGVNFRLNPDALLYAKYARGYQSGGFNTDFFPYLPSIEFEDESVDAFEIGVKSLLAGGTLQINADVFLQKYEDLQVFQRIPREPSGVVVALTNAGEATSQGVEFEGIWLPVERLQLTLNATFLDATYDKFENVPVPGTPTSYDGNDLSYAPEWKLYAGAQYSQPVAGHELVFSLDYSYQDVSWSGPNQSDLRYRIGSYELWNARVTFNPAGGNWQLTAWWNNVTDEEYYTNRSPASLTNIDRVVWGMPGFWGLTFNYFMGN